MLQRGFSRFGGANGEIVEVAPVTLPALSCLKVPVVDDGAERREIADKFAEFRTVRLGAECWQSISKSGSFENWSHIAKALLVGKNVALRASDTNRGRRYALAFSAWAQQHGFDRMPAATRSTAIQLGENLAAITQWRSTLPEPQRKRLTHPQSIVCRWRASTAHNGKSRTDLRREAKAAWARFCACTKALPADEAQPLWQLIASEATNSRCTRGDIPPGQRRGRGKRR